MNQMVKDAKSVIYKMVLIQDRIYTFEEANRTINKWRKDKNTRIQQRSVLNVQNTNALLAVKEMDTQLREEMRTSGRGQDGDRTIIRRCGNCSKPRHNV